MNGTSLPANNKEGTERFRGCRSAPGPAHTITRCSPQVRPPRRGLTVTRCTLTTRLTNTRKKTLPKGPPATPASFMSHAVTTSARGTWERTDSPGCEARAGKATACTGPSQDAAGAPPPVLLFDVMDTLVVDPFFEHIPPLFELSLEEFYAAQESTVWFDFEKGQITERQLAQQLFKDQRIVDLGAIKTCLRDRYAWVDGMEQVLSRLCRAQYELHAFSNYPAWYTDIEEKLGLSRYLRWSAVSCHLEARKPEAVAFERAAAAAGAEVQRCVFVDDRLANVEAARALGMRALHFRGCARTLEADLLALGIRF